MFLNATITGKSDSTEWTIDDPSIIEACNVPFTSRAVKAFHSGSWHSLYSYPWERQAA